MLVLFGISCQNKEQESFSFVQICDPQFGMSGYKQEKNTTHFYQQDTSSFIQAVKQINKLSPDFVIICGDFVHNATDSTFNDFIALKNTIEMPCYLVPGNHDVDNVPNDSTLAYYRKLFGHDYFSITHKGYQFIFTNTQLWKCHIENESQKHDEWFKKNISTRNDKEIKRFVVGHIPLYINQPNEEEKYFNLPLKKRLELLQLFEENKVVAYLSGHKHESIINSYKNIQLVTGESTSFNFDKRPLGFRYWEVRDDTVKNTFIPLEGNIDVN